jgi:hypothetical protein
MPQSRDTRRQTGFFPPLFSTMLQEVVSIQGLEPDSRAVVDGLELTVGRQGRSHITLQAQRMTLGHTSRHIVFQEDLTLRALHGEQLDAQAAEWQSSHKRFFIRGRYVFRDATGTHVGTRAAFIIDHTGIMHAAVERPRR